MDLSRQIPVATDAERRSDSMSVSFAGPSPQRMTAGLPASGINMASGLLPLKRDRSMRSARNDSPPGSTVPRFVSSRSGRNRSMVSVFLKPVAAARVVRFIRPSMFMPLWNRTQIDSRIFLPGLRFRGGGEYQGATSKSMNMRSTSTAESFTRIASPILKRLP